MFHSTCGMGDIFSMFQASTTLGPPPPPPPPPPPAVVQVQTTNVVQTDSGMPGGDIASQYMPGGAPQMKINLGPNAAAIVACLQKKGTWNAKTGTCTTPPSIALRFGNLFAKQTVQMTVPPNSKTKILLFGGGGTNISEAIPAPLSIGFEQRDGLWIVSAAALPVLQTALSGMAYASSDPSGMSGQASFMLPSSSEAILTANFVVNNHITQGHAALLDKASVGTGSFKFIFTGDPAVVAQLAGGPSAQYALVTDKPDAVVAGALAKMNGGTVPAASVATPMPWLAIGVVGAGLLIAGALYATRKPAHATANAGKKRKLSKEQWAARQYAKKARAARRARRAAREDYL